MPTRAMDQRRQAALGVLGQPAVDRIRLPPLVQALGRNRKRGLAIGDLQQTGRDLAEIGAGIVIPRLLKLGALRRGQD